MKTPLKEYDKIFWNMFDRNNAIMLLIDTVNGGIIAANGAASEFYGYSCSELSRMNIKEINQLSPGQIKEAMRSSQKENINYFVFPHKLASGEVRTVEVHSTPIKIAEGEILFSIIHDITERTQVEEELLQRRAELEAIYNSITDAVIFTDQKRRIVMTNKAFGEMFGYKHEEVAGQTTKIIYADPKMYLKQGKERFKSNAKIDNPVFYNEYRRKDGTLFQSETLGVPVKNENGEVLGFLGIIRDITQRKQVEEALRDSEANYREIVENTEDLITKTSKEGRFLFVNHAASKIFGVSPEDCLGLSAFDFVHPDDHERTEKWFTDSVRRKKKKASIENRQINKLTGKIYTLQWSASFKYDSSGKLIGAGGIARDITLIRNAERQYENLFEKMLDGFALHEIICNDEGVPVDYRYLSINPAYEAQTGLKAKDLLGKTVLEVFPGTEKHWIDVYGRVALTGESILFEKHSAELDKYFEVTAYSPAKNQFACIFQDISLRKKAEEEKKQLEARFQRAQKVEAIGTLAGGIAHDFNNILSAVLGYAEMARDDSPEGSTVASDLDKVLEAGNKAKDLVQQILDFSRQSETEPIPLHPVSIVKETIKMLRSTLPTTIEINQEITSETVQILADPAQFHQVIMNLSTNAFQAMEKTGGELTISLQKITLSNEDLVHEPNIDPGNFMQLSVFDTGPGITTEIKDKIFDPYFTTKEIGKGTGMGLSVIHGIIKSYGGFITVYSKLGKGSEFHVFLPILEGQVLPEVEEAEQVPSGRERILFIDDEELVSNMGKVLLERLGYHVTVRNSSIDALETFLNHPDTFDLVITDQTMPGMTGSDIARRMIQIRPDIPIILCTGHSTIISEEKAKSIGIKEYALKPITKKEIAKLIRKVLDGN